MKRILKEGAVLLASLLVSILAFMIGSGSVSIEEKQEEQEQESEMRHKDKPRNETLDDTNERKDVLEVNIPGLQVNFGPDCESMGSTRLCFHCCEEGKEHPIEHFLRYHCCGHFICKDCIVLDYCGECLTTLPFGNFSALSWILNTNSRLASDIGRRMHLIGRIMIHGAHTFLDELIRMPHYNYKKVEPASQMLAIMNPTQVQDGVDYLTRAAEDHGELSAMLDLADAYCTSFKNDSFRPNMQKAEEWYVKALGKNNKFSPMAFTRYGDFLMWNGRYKEAKVVYKVAATSGHPRGQYEYAVFLANESSKTLDTEKMEEALRFLCAACEKGFHATSYTFLAKLLVEISEKEYGTVYVTGKSPMPRILQILKLALKSTPCYGFPYHSIERKQWENETTNLLEDYEESLKKCANCGQAGTEANPLRFCEGCNKNTAYCSNICQKRDYRDGHKFDCCYPKNLFNFKSLRMTLPWVSKCGWKRYENDPLPRLSSTGERSLLQMVEDDTDEVYGEEDQDFDEAILTNIMFRMRKNLETYLSKELIAPSNKTSNPFLNNQIELFAKEMKKYPGCDKFVKAMHEIRTLGNSAVHYNDAEEKKITQMKCEQAVHSYREEKELYEKYKMKSKNTHNEIKQVEDTDVCNDLVDAEDSLRKILNIDSSSQTTAVEDEEVIVDGHDASDSVVTGDQKDNVDNSANINTHKQKKKKKKKTKSIGKKGQKQK